MTHYYRLKLDQLDNLEFLIASDYAEDFPMHYHETFCVSLIEQGTFDENGLIATKGTICITPPNLIHENKLLHETGYSFITFYVSPDLFRFLNQGKEVFFSNMVLEDDTIFAELKNIAQQLKTNKKNIPSKTTLTDIFKRLVQKYHDPLGKPDDSNNTPLILAEIKNYVEINLHEKLTLEDLAKLADMDKFKFIRYFKKNIGLSPFSYITLRRLEHAKNSLKAGNPIVHSALDAGFYDQSHFNKYFKHYIGVTPFDYLRHCNILQD
jgi:AraC-like DNA-binding protein